jgi:hypothetical protein
MSQAQEVREQVYKHYTYEGKIYINHQDVAQHLREGEVDSGTPSVHTSTGVTSSYDDSLTVIYFKDGSALVIDCGEIYPIGGGEK